MTTEPTTAISRRRRPKGRYQKTQDGAAPKREKRIPEYLEADEVNAIIRAAPSPTLRVRSGKGGMTRLVPVHPELHGALSSALAYGDIT